MAGRRTGRGDDPPLAELDPDAKDVDSWDDDAYDDPEAEDDDGYDDPEAEDEYDDDGYDGAVAPAATVTPFDDDTPVAPVAAAVAMVDNDRHDGAPYDADADDEDAEDAEDAENAEGPYDEDAEGPYDADDEDADADDEDAEDADADDEDADAYDDAEDNADADAEEDADADAEGPYDDDEEDEYDDEYDDDPVGAPAVAAVKHRTLVSVADEADDGWYDYDEELDGDDGYADDDGYDHPWPPPAPDPVPVPVGASANANDPSIWAPATAPGAWVALGRPRFDNPLHGLLTAPLQARTRRRNLSVFSLAGITNVLLLAYGVTAVLLAGFTAALARRRSALEIVDVKSRAATTLRAEQLVDATSLGVAALLGATAIASMVWCAVAAHNQRMLAEADGPPSPAAAALGWLVPLANLVLPYRTVAMLSAGPFGNRDVLRSVRVWWLCWLTSLIAAQYVIVASRAPESARDASWLTLVALLVTALFLLCFSQAITVFRGIARLQHDLAVERD